ncbi:hypothetical protein MRX96_056304 [Rhipicephalus microplus]
MVAGHVALSGVFASLTRIGGRRHLLVLSAFITAVCMVALSPLKHAVFSHWTVENRPRLTDWNGIYAIGLLLASYSLGTGSRARVAGHRAASGSRALRRSGELVGRPLVPRLPFDARRCLAQRETESQTLLAIESIVCR